MERFDAIWLRAIKVIAFLLGAWIMYHETVSDIHQKPYLYAAAIALMGLQVVDLVESVLGGLGQVLSGIGKHPTELPPKGESDRSTSGGSQDGP